MGTSLSYNTVEPVSPDTRQRASDFLESRSNEREWWAESIILFDNPNHPGKICGDTKLFCLIDDDSADCYMAMKDATFIIEQLETVSEEHGIEWELSLAGEPAGKIQDGHRDDTVQQMLDSFDLIADVADVDFSQYDRDSLLKQHPDR